MHVCMLLYCCFKLYYLHTHTPTAREEAETCRGRTRKQERRPGVSSQPGEVTTAGGWEGGWEGGREGGREGVVVGGNSVW